MKGIARRRNLRGIRSPRPARHMWHVDQEMEEALPMPRGSRWQKCVGNTYAGGFISYSIAWLPIAQWKWTVSDAARTLCGTGRASNMHTHSGSCIQWGTTFTVVLVCLCWHSRLFSFQFYASGWWMGGGKGETECPWNCGCFPDVLTETSYRPLPSFDTEIIPPFAITEGISIACMCLEERRSKEGGGFKRELRAATLKEA